MALLAPAEVGKLIRTARQKKGLTQRQLAERLDVSQGCISNWEQGDRSPGRVHIAALATQLGVRLSSLVLG